MPQPQTPRVPIGERLSYSVTDAAGVVGCSRKHITLEIKAGHLKAHRTSPGAHPRILREDLLAWLTAYDYSETAKSA